MLFTTFWRMLMLLWPVIWNPFNQSVWLLFSCSTKDFKISSTLLLILDSIKQLASVLDFWSTPTTSPFTLDPSIIITLSLLVLTLRETHDCWDVVHEPLLDTTNIGQEGSHTNQDYRTSKDVLHDNIRR